MEKNLDAYSTVLPIGDGDFTTFTVTMVNGRKSYIDGADIKDIFGKIDGLRLEGKRWLETYDFYFADQLHKIFVNIDQIVSVE